jgi:uncharacterized membrane protein
MRWIVFAGLRSARRGGTGQKTDWQPLTKVIWIFVIFAVPIAVGGAARVIALCILGVIAALVVFGVAYGIAHRNDKPERDLIAEYFEQQEGSNR